MNSAMLTGKLMFNDDPLQLFIPDNKIIVCGGMGSDTNPKDTLCAYDVETNTWKQMKGMPTARYATYSFLVNEKLYVCGKWINDGLH